MSILGPDPTRERVHEQSEEPIPSTEHIQTADNTASNTTNNTANVAQRRDRRRGMAPSAALAARSSRLQIGALSGAKDRARQFCFREQYKNYDRSVEVVVGPEKVKYRFPQDLLAVQSPFFAAAFDGQMTEGQSGTISLPDVEPKIFDHIVLWFFAQKLDKVECFFKDGKPTYFTLLDIYGLADQLCIEGLRNAVVDLMGELAEQTNSVPTPMDTNLLYENVRDKAPIRRLVLDLFAYKKTDNLVLTHPDDWHPDFLRELICKLKRPGPAALLRHDLRPWRPVQWNTSKGCEFCKSVLKPNTGGNMCGHCSRAYCHDCVRKVAVNGDGGPLDWNVAERSCKPWLHPVNRCDFYHDHQDSEKCGVAEVWERT